MRSRPPSSPIRPPSLPARPAGAPQDQARRRPGGVCKGPSAFPAPSGAAAMPSVADGAGALLTGMPGRKCTMGRGKCDGSDESRRAEPAGRPPVAALEAGRPVSSCVTSMTTAGGAGVAGGQRPHGREPLPRRCQGDIRQHGDELGRDVRRGVWWNQDRKYKNEITSERSSAWPRSFICGRRTPAAVTWRGRCESGSARAG